jgi:hypothetical protein
MRMRINSYRREMEDKVCMRVFQGRIQSPRKRGQLKERKKKKSIK